MSLFNKEQGAQVRAHFKDPRNKLARIELHHHVNITEIATVWRSDLEPFYYWLDVRHVPHKRAGAAKVTYEGRAFDTIEQLLNHYTHS